MFTSTSNITEKGRVIHMSDKVFIIGSEGLGNGDDKLGSLLIANFFRLLGESQSKPKSIVFWNTGVKLCCTGSDVLDHIKKLASQGVEILACTTCLEYFDLLNKLKVGKPTTMLNSIQSMLSDNIVSL